MLQIRPLGVPNSVYYSPQRDLAHVGLNYVNYSLAVLDHVINTKPEWFSEYCKTNNINKEELIEGINTFIRSVGELCLNKATQETSPFMSVRFPVQALILYTIAQVFVSASVNGWKEAVSMETVQSITAEEFLEKSLPYAKFFGRSEGFSLARFVDFVTKHVLYCKEKINKRFHSTQKS